MKKLQFILLIVIPVLMQAQNYRVDSTETRMYMYFPKDTFLLMDFQDSSYYFVVSEKNKRCNLSAFSVNKASGIKKDVSNKIHEYNDSVSTDGIEVSLYSGGKPEFVKFFRNGMEDGFCYWFFEKKKMRIASYTEYQNGLKNGLDVCFRQNKEGRVFWLKRFSDGHPNGTQKKYFRTNGKITALDNYFFGQRNGYCYDYYTSGRKQISWLYFNGTVAIKRVMWRNGEIKYVTFFSEKGQAESTEYYKRNGKLKSTVCY